MTNQTLKACPFCGHIFKSMNPIEEVMDDGNEMNELYQQCVCGAKGPPHDWGRNDYKVTAERAIESWNTRPAPPLGLRLRGKGICLKLEK